jgi:hypothetical protein
MTGSANHTELVTVLLRADISTRWDDLRDELANHRVAWTDADGLHVTESDNLPENPPRYATHLWAWNRDTLTRVRITERHFHIATIALGAPTDHDGTVVKARFETGLRIWDASGRTASIRLAPDTSPDIIGRPAEAFTVISTTASGLAFFRTASAP